MIKVLRVYAILMLIAPAICFKTNITQFGNCIGILHVNEKYPVEVYDVQYENKDGFVNTVHGKYNVRTLDARNKEFSTVRKRPKDNAIIMEGLSLNHCIVTNSGIWYMISRAMSGSHCGEMTGTFDLHGVTLENEYLIKYITDKPEKGRYHLRMLFHTKSGTIDDGDVRGCVSIEFDIL